MLFSCLTLSYPIALVDALKGVGLFLKLAAERRAWAASLSQAQLVSVKRRRCSAVRPMSL